MGQKPKEEKKGDECRKMLKKHKKKKKHDRGELYYTSREIVT
jgi:hypothetical protein